MIRESASLALYVIAIDKGMYVYNNVGVLSMGMYLQRVEMLPSNWYYYLHVLYS